MNKNFDLSCVQSPFSTRLFEVIPLRHVHFDSLKLSAAQSTVLATRPHPIQVTFSECTFKNKDATFVNALENRQSSFGSLTLVDCAVIHDDHLERLLQLDNVIQHLGLSADLDNPELSFLALFAKVDSLDC